jgi:hypothetical protein
MKVHTRLNAVEGQVLCPHNCEWKSVEECAHCAELSRIEQDGARTTIVCAPEIDRPLGSVLQDMVRA